MKFRNSRPRLSPSAQQILHPQVSTSKKFILAILSGCSIASQVAIEKDLLFILRDSTLFQFSNALYPDRVRPIPSPVSASEIAPEIIKKIGYNLIHTGTGLIWLDYRNNHITIVTVRTKVGRVLEWQSGEIISQ